MPHVQANNLEVYYEVQREGEPLVLIPYLAADQACYEFQVADYAKRFSCYTVDLRGAGLTSKPEGTYTTELFADDVAAFMQAVGITRAHVSGLSLGAATGMWLAAKYPSLVKSLSVHSGWTATDPYLRAVVQRLPAPVGGGARARRGRRAHPHPGTDPDHLRPVRRRHLCPVRRPADRGDQGRRARHLRGLRAHAHLRKRG